MNVPAKVVIDLNQDSKTLEQCLKGVYSYGHTTYMNICTGTETTVPWGGVDWVLNLTLTALGVGVVLAILIGLAILCFDR